MLNAATEVNIFLAHSLSGCSFISIVIISRCFSSEHVKFAIMLSGSSDGEEKNRETVNDETDFIG